ncbi:PrgI family protein [Butyrivibrio sp. FC2001]|uniref:PrgI family protein n=1 Tax=Butyrivibrio sp. FC2001 TaxID=1280671 RepID=UPI001A999DA9|nr:PrgI family protein [Butyrivibrio sp. FC2001]
MNKIKDRPIYGFTVRQILSFLAIGIIGVPVYIILMNNHIDTTISCLIICFMAIPIFFIGTYEDVHGRYLEKIIKDKVRLMFLTSSERPFATNNSFDAIRKQRKLEEKYDQMVRDGKKRLEERKKISSRRKEKIKRILRINSKKGMTKKDA